MSGGGKVPGEAYDKRLARLVIRPLAGTPITPNLLTLAGMLMGLLAAWLFSLGEPGVSNWAGLLFAIAVFMDHVDGEHARATGLTSRFGHYFDHVAALVTYASMFIGVGIGLSDGGLGEWAIVLGACAGLAVAAIFSARLWVEERHGASAVQQTPRGGFEIEDTLYIVAPIAWLDALEPFLIAAGIGAPAFLLWVIWDAIRITRANNRRQTAR